MWQNLQETVRLVLDLDSGLYKNQVPEKNTRNIIVSVYMQKTKAQSLINSQRFYTNCIGKRVLGKIFSTLKADKEKWQKWRVLLLCRNSIS